MSIAGKLVGQAVQGIAKAEVVRRDKNPAWWWFTRILIGFVLLVGWIFILWQNKFHVDAPVVVICLGYLAVVLALANLWRVGAAAVAEDALVEDTWARPVGAREELEREKKTLLKSIKEAEFNREMGKLSKVDADELIRMYRARAIEVIKELDRMEGAAEKAETPRQAIERELAARVALDQEQAKGKKRKKDRDKDKSLAKKAKAEPAKAAAAAKPAPAVDVAEASATGSDGEGDEDEDDGEDAPESTVETPAAATDAASSADTSDAKTSSEASS